jgi:hypothetical protein
MSEARIEARLDRLEEDAREIKTTLTRLEPLIIRIDERLRADPAESRADRAESALADAMAAERIAAGEAAVLRAELDRRRSWGLLRRLRG